MFVKNKAAVSVQRLGY